MIHIILLCFVFTGVYISKYADCLQPRPWYHGKSGYIVICKLIKVKQSLCGMVFRSHCAVQTVFKVSMTIVGCKVSSVESS